MTADDPMTIARAAETRVTRAASIRYRGGAEHIENGHLREAIALYRQAVAALADERDDAAKRRAVAS